MGSNHGWSGSAAPSSHYKDYVASQSAASSSSSYDALPASLTGGPQQYAMDYGQQPWHASQQDRQYAAPHLTSTASIPTSTSMPFDGPVPLHQHSRDHRHPSTFHDFHSSIAGPSIPNAWSHPQHHQSYQPQQSHSPDSGNSFLPQRFSPHSGSSLSLDSLQAYRMGVPMQNSESGSPTAPPSATMSSHSVMTSLPTSFAPPPIRSPITHDSSIPTLTLTGLPSSAGYGASPLLRKPSTAATSHFVDDDGSSSAGTATTGSFNPSPTSQAGLPFPPTDVYSHPHSHSQSQRQSIASSSTSRSTILSPVTTSALSSNPLTDQDRADEILKRLRSRASDSKEGIAACDYCRKRKIRCDRVKPTCGKCLSLGKQCATTDTLRKRGPPSKKEKELLAAQGLHFIPSRVRRKSVNQDEAAIMAAAAQGQAQGHGRPHASSTSSTSSSSVSTLGSGTAGSSTAAERWLGPSSSSTTPSSSSSTPTTTRKKKGRASHGSLKSVKQEGGTMARLTAAASSPELHSIMVGLSSSFSSAASPIQRVRSHEMSSDDRRSLDATGAPVRTSGTSSSGRSVSARASPSGMTAAGTGGRRQPRPSLGVIRVRDHDGDGSDRVAGPSRTYSDPSMDVHLRWQDQQGAASEQGQVIAALLAADMQRGDTEAKRLVNTQLQHQHEHQQDVTRPQLYHPQQQQQQQQQSPWKAAVPSAQPPSGAHLLFFGSGGGGVGALPNLSQ